MGLIQNISKLFQGQTVIQKANIDYGKFRDYLLQFQQSEPIWKVQEEKDYIHNGYLYNDRIYSIIRLLTRNASMIKVYLYEVKDKKAHNRLKAAKLNGDVSVYKTEAYQRKALREVESGHPVLQVLENPNPLQGWAEFVENALGYKYLLGNNYIMGVGPNSGSNAGMFKEMWNLPAQYTRIIPGKYSFDQPIEFYEVNINGTSKIKLDAAQVCHLKYWSPDYEGGKGSHYYGVSPIRALSRKIQLDNDQTRTMVKQLQSMGIMGMFVLDDPSGAIELDQVEAAKIERQYYQKLQTGRTMFMNARWRWEQAGMSPVDLAIIDSAGLTLRDLCSGFGISSQLLNDPSNKTYNNMRDARKSMWNQGILPDYNAMIDQLNPFLLKPFNQNRQNYVIDYDMESIPDLQEDLRDKISYLKEMFWLTPNQKLEATGWETSTDPNMDKVYLPGNLVPIDQMNGEGAMDPLEMDEFLRQNGIEQSEQ